MKKVFFTLLTLLIAHAWAQNTIEKDSVTQLDEVLIQATRIKKTDPFTQTNLNKTEIESRNLGQDVPALLNYLPNIVTTSNAGTGVGYTGIRVRGSDATKVNVTINGIPLNDSESHGVYWVDLPDFASSTQSMQLQRGVGTSTNGGGAFGASLNILTEGFSDKVGLISQNSFGSFNTQKHNLEFQSGKLGEHFNFSGRISIINSDGYVDRAASDLKSFFVNAGYSNAKTLIKFISFGGHEKTYQAWYGIDKQKYDENPTFNYAGAIYDSNWIVTGYYDNQVDDYTQNHYQLHVNQNFNPNLNLTFALHYTKGYGFYEEYAQNEAMADYNLSPVAINGTDITSTDLIRQKWLDNDFYGTTLSLKYTKTNFNLISGGAFSIYNGDHFGKVIWARYASDSEKNHQYYFNNGLKKDFNIFSKMQYALTDKWNVFFDLQLRNVNYKTQDFLLNDIDKNWMFFNPKAGLTYQLNVGNQIYTSYARASREPLREDFEYATTEPKPEKLDNFELGWRYIKNNNLLQINAYAMLYKDQLVLTGGLTDTGSYIRTNSGKSYRIGVELESQIALGEKIKWLPNFSLSQNKNTDFYFENVNSFQDTYISFSPTLVAGNQLMFDLSKALQFSLLNKYVSSQYLDNYQSNQNKLDAYFISDFQVQWVKNDLFGIKKVRFSGIINNIFNQKYASNGYVYDHTPYYFPQAGINFLAGVDLSI